MLKLTIDGREVEVAAGTSVLQACEQLGIEIPRFCYHKKLKVAGSCRMCLVEIEKAPKLAASCATPCADGMNVRTNTAAVQRARKGVMELLLLNHPLDCPVCDQGGACDLQDQAVAYGADRGRSHEHRREVSDKDLGPLIKTVMTRCIHCTRCVRFANDIAGTPELGGLFRGEDMEIDTGTGKPLVSELSGNLADVCPVGALTHKPNALRFRPWELTGTDSIDVMDAVGSAIRIDTRGGEIMRIVPRENEAINETWLADKARYACDGLRVQRLETPFIRVDGSLKPATWDEALSFIAAKLKNVGGEKIAALAGDLADCESVFALKKLMQALGSPHMDCRQDGAVYDASVRAGYIMNSAIAGIDEADAILLVGVNPRHAAALVNARIRKRWLQGALAIGLVGQAVDLTYPYDHLGESPWVVRDMMNGRVPFADVLKNARRPMVLLGAGALARPDGAALQALVRDMAETFRMIRPDWNGYNVMQLAAGRTGALDLGFVPAQGGLATNALLKAASDGEIDAVYLLGADEIDIKRLGRAFVIYQGHHGDRGAHRADVILPGAAYTEKDATYVNTEGRPQQTRKALAPPGEAKEDWGVVCLVAGALGRPLPFDSLTAVRAAMVRDVPLLGTPDAIPRTAWKSFGKPGTLSSESLESPYDNYYMTNAICRASPTMARCTEEILPFLMKGGK